jgi:hypothetical protein
MLYFIWLDNVIIVLLDEILFEDISLHIDSYIIDIIIWGHILYCQFCRGMDAEGVSGTAGHATWAPTWSAYMLEYLANLVVSGTKTSSTFMMVHYNGCAKALQQKFGIVRSGD